MSRSIQRSSRQNFTNEAFLVESFDPSRRSAWAVEDTLYGEEKIWEVHQSCAGKCLVPGLRPFIVREYLDIVTSDEVIAQARQDGCRPATLEETCALIDAERATLIHDAKDRVIVLGSSYHTENTRAKIVICFGLLKSGKLNGMRMEYETKWPPHLMGRVKFVLVWENDVPKNIGKIFNVEPRLLTSAS